MAMTTYGKLSSDGIVQIITSLLLMLWSYAALSKLIREDYGRMAMSQQIFPPVVAEVLTFAVPAIELLTTIYLLVKPKTGLWLSAISLMLFTLYLALVKLQAFSRIPCSCGGVLEQLSYAQHLIFNLFFLAINLAALLIWKPKSK